MEEVSNIINEGVQLSCRIVRIRRSVSELEIGSEIKALTFSDSYSSIEAESFAPDKGPSS